MKYDLKSGSGILGSSSLDITESEVMEIASLADEITEVVANTELPLDVVLL